MNTAREYTVRLQELLRRERLALADFLVAVAEFDARRLWVELGYTSLFYFLHRELGLSKGAAHYRKTAAELIQRFPEIVEPLRDGRLCITTIVELAKVITPENRGEVLPRFFQLSKSEAKEVTAELRPDESPPRRELVTPLRRPEAPALALAAAADVGQLVQPANQPKEAERTAEPPHMAAPPMPRTPGPAVEPLTAEVSRVHVTVSRRFLTKLEAARDALSHSHPNAGIEEILEAGLDLLLERQAKRRGLVKKPRPEPRPSSDPDYVPAQVRRAVWKRDGGRCQFRLANGEICGSTVRVEIDHVEPRALGGPSTVENCRLACRVHNDRAARRVFGDPWMDRFTRNPRARPAGDGRSGGAHAPGRSPTAPLRVREEPAPYAASRRCRGRMASASWRPPRTIPSSISGG